MYDLLPDEWGAETCPDPSHNADLVRMSLRAKGYCTTPPQPSLSMLTMEGVSREMEAFGVASTHDQRLALTEVATTLEAMAEGVCPPQIHLSSLDPGVGKTTTLIEFIKQIVASTEHCHVGVLVGLSRLDEVERLVEECGLVEADFAVFTGDEERNAMSSTPHSTAQIFFTTQQMLTRRCKTVGFAQCSTFHFMGSPRPVRVWDETLEPGEVLTLSRDHLASLSDVLRPISGQLADLVLDLTGQLGEHEPGDVVEFPMVDQDAVRQAISSASSNDIARRLGTFAAMSGRSVRLLKGAGKQRIALDIRDAVPNDLAPFLVLDASGRVRQTYAHWEQQRGGLVRLRSATKLYDPLTIHVLDQGGGKDSWQNNGDQLAREIATVIDSKPDEPWLVVHHKAAGKSDPEKAIKQWMDTDRSRVNFITWGKHQATNDFKHIANVVLAGTLFLPESQYLGLAHASSGVPTGEDLPPHLVDDIRLGEHGHGVLQALCRGAVRGSDGEYCSPCTAYIIAAKGSRIRAALPEWFPGCRVQNWRPRHRPPRQQVAKAVAYVEQRLKADPTTPIPFSDLMAVLAIHDKSNFNRTIRHHHDFGSAIERLSLDEVALDGSRHKNALCRCWGPDPDLVADEDRGLQGAEISEPYH